MTDQLSIFPSREQDVDDRTPIEESSLTNARLAVAKIANREQWEALLPEWWALLEETRGNVGQSPLWAQSMQNGTKKRSSLSVLTIRDRHRLVGVFPMVSTRRLFLGFTMSRELRFATTGLADILAGRDALVLLEARHDAALALSAYLLEHPGICSRLVLQDVTEDSFAAEFLPPLWEALGWDHSVQNGSEYFSLTLPRSMEEFSAGCDAETKAIIAGMYGPVGAPGEHTAVGVSTSVSVDGAIALAHASNEPPVFRPLADSLHAISPNELLLRSADERGWLWSATSTSPDGEWAGCSALLSGNTAIILHRRRLIEHGGNESLEDKKVLLALVKESIQRGCTTVRFDRPERLFARHKATQKIRLRTITLRAPVTAAAAPPYRTSVVVHSDVSPTHRDDGCDVRVLTTEKDFFALRVEWEGLVKDASAGIFQSFDWQWTWWRHFGRQRSLYILEVRKSGSLVGLFPLFSERTIVAGYLLRQVLRPIGSPVSLHPLFGPKAGIGVTDYTDIIAAPAHAESVAASISRFLEQHADDFDCLVIQDVPASGQLPRQLVPVLTASGFRVSTTPSIVCPYLPTPPSVDAFIDGLEGQTKRRFQKARQLTKERRGFTLEVVRSEKVVRSILQDLIHLHQVRWRRLGSPGLFDDPRFRSFMLELAPVLFSKGQLWVGAIVMGGVRTAVRLAFRWNGRLYDYVAGFDETLPGANKGPGYSLLLALIDDAVRNDIAAIDLLRGRESYKFDITTKSEANTHIVVRSPRARSMLRRSLARVYDIVVMAIQQVNTELHVFAALREHWSIPQSVQTYLSLTVAKFTRRLRSSTTNEPKQRESKKTPRGSAPKASWISSIPLLNKMRQGLERDSDLPLRHVFRKGLVFLRSLLIAPLALSSCTSVGKRPRTRGWPIIENDGSIRIGDDFNLNSRQVPSELAAGPGGTLVIGNEVSINRGCSLCALDRIEIGDRVRIGPYTLVMDSDFHVIGKRHARATTHPVIIGDDVWVGSRVTILKGANIGVGSVITAGSVVSGMIPAGVVAGGVPARVIRKFSSERPATPETRRPAPGRPESIPAEEIVRKVKQVYARTFRVDVPETLAHGPFDTPQWDSLGQLNLIVAIEEAFDIHLADEDMLNIVDLQSLCAIVSSHIVKVQPSRQRQEEVRA